MAYLIGMDEAGYGPNLGPLVVSASVWQVPDQLVDADWYDVLAGVVRKSTRDKDPRIAISDSKLLYQPGSGLARLERGVLTALASIGKAVHSWQSVWDALEGDLLRDRDRLPWYAAYDRPVPIDCDGELIDEDAATFSDGLAACGIELIGLASRAVFPTRFNELVAQFDSKAEALSRITLELASELLKPLAGESIHVVCDKHGGRNRYAALLQQQWPDVLVEVRGESRAESIYRFGSEQRRVEFRFRTKADQLVPAALASMASKYLRELAMQAFNTFWCSHIEGLRPTAGYPVDAKRFRTEIEPARVELQIADGKLWRCR